MEQAPRLPGRKWTLMGTTHWFDQITARYSGFSGADDYYHRASSSRVAAQIAVPTLILHALDDPFIRMLPSTREALLANQGVELIETAHGGLLEAFDQRRFQPGETLRSRRPPRR